MLIFAKIIIIITASRYLNTHTIILKSIKPKIPTIANLNILFTYLSTVIIHILCIRLFVVFQICSKAVLVSWKWSDRTLPVWRQKVWPGARSSRLSWPIIGCNMWRIGLLGGYPTSQDRSPVCYTHWTYRLLLTSIPSRHVLSTLNTEIILWHRSTAASYRT